VTQDRIQCHRQFLFYLRGGVRLAFLLYKASQLKKNLTLSGSENADGSVLGSDAVSTGIFHAKTNQALGL
jgi:hypothetical protein